MNWHDIPLWIKAVAIVVLVPLAIDRIAAAVLVFWMLLCEARDWVEGGPRPNL